MTRPLVHRERPHSDMGPSSFDRAEACPASVAPGPRSTRTSVYAEEGTAAHTLFETALITGGEVYEWAGDPVAGTSFEVTEQMIDALDPMVMFVRDTFLPGFAVEQAVRLPDVPDMYGYADVCGYVANKVHAVADLKYGHTYVPADTTQLGLYLLMHILATTPPEVWAETHEEAVVGKTFVLQPNLPDPIRSHLWRKQDLTDLHDRARQVSASRGLPNPAYNAGEHCKWCARAPFCPRLQLLAKSAALSAITPDPANPPDPAELDQMVALLPAVEQWAAAVRATMEAYVLAGGALTEAKAVLGRGAREWRDPAAAEALMRKHGADPYTAVKLKSPYQAEQSLPKPVRGAVADMVRHTPGQIKVVLAGDPGDPVKVPAALRNAELAAQARRAIAKGG